MRFRGRVLSVGVLTVLLLALPASSLAASAMVTKQGTVSAGSGAAVTLAGVPAVQPAFATVPGARIGVVGSADLVAYGNVGGATIVDNVLANGRLFYNSAGGWVLAPLGLPAGATLWQVDVYGWALPPGASQAWVLYEQGSEDGNFNNVGSANIATGSGIRTGTISFPTGLMLPAGYNFQIGLNGTSSTNGFDGVIFQYTLPTVSLMPITPVRVFDSRFSSRLVQGAPRTINVKNAINITTGAVTVTNAIPQGARAISFTITVTDTGSVPGYVAVLPGTTTTLTVSTVNWTSGGATVAAGGIVSLGTGAAERQITLVVGGPGTSNTNVIVDVTGYYM